MLKKAGRMLALLMACTFLAPAVPALETRARELPLAALELPLAGQAKGAAVIEQESGLLLFGKDADRRLPMASTTKIMTALLTLEQDDLDAPFTVDKNAIRVEGSSMGLREGDTVTLRALAYGMLLPSGNDAAGAAAVRIAGTKERFAQLMNERAEELELTGTHFVTPSGLDDSNHYSTAFDLALLAREALQNSEFAEICGQSSAKVRYGNPPYDRWLTNHNKLLKYYPGVVGVKTGFTDTAGRCLVSAAERDGMKLIVVTLGCPDDWNTHMKLYDACFAKLRRRTVELPADPMPVTGAGTVGVEWDGCEVTAPADAALELTVTRQPFLFAPAQAGRVVGWAAVRADGAVVGEFTLRTTEGATLPGPEKSRRKKRFG